MPSETSALYEPIPFSEPPYLLDLASIPYYRPSHYAWQQACRAFITDNLLQHAFEWENEGDVPSHVFQEFSTHHVLLANLPAPLPVEWLKRLGVHDVLGVVQIEDWDYFHTAIFADEMARAGIAGPSGAITTGYTFGLPPILRFGSTALQERVIPDLLLGKTRTCIAITEPGAGSDVANIATTATKSDDGKFYIVNGVKKWISNALWADYATMAVRTGGPGPSGLSLLLVPLKGTSGVSITRVSTSGLISAGTTEITLTNVRVQVENLIGDEGKGMYHIMTNFNHERIMIAVGVTRQARVALSAAFEYCMQRSAFGKPLMEQAVVRHRLAKAGAELESMWAWTETFIHQLCHLNKSDADVKLGGLTAMAKAKAGMVLNECAQCAVVLFGGSGYTKTGPGEVAEKIYRDVPAARIAGGSEDVMFDLAIRQLVENYQHKIKTMERPKGSNGVVSRDTDTSAEP